MTINDLRALPVLITQGVNSDAQDTDTRKYILSCLTDFFSGNYGEVSEDDTEANNADLAEGCGHVLAAYKAKGKLTGKIWIEAHFDKVYLDNPEYSQIVIMYPSER